MKNNHTLKNNVVLITGSTSGIGRETAVAFSKENAQVIVTFHNHPAVAEEVVKDCIQAGGVDPFAISLDIRATASILNAFDIVKEKVGSIDILVNNAGIIQWKKLEEQTLYDIDQQVMTNLAGPIKMTKVFLPIIKKSIINVASGAGKTGYPGLAPYSATKFGIRGFTAALAEEIKNIQVYAVNPGMTATKMTGYRGDDPEDVAQIIVDTARGKYDVPSGKDIDVWEYVK